MSEHTNHEQKKGQESPAELLAVFTTGIEERLSDERYKPFIKIETRPDGGTVTEITAGDLEPILRKIEHPERKTRYETDIYYVSPDENVIRSWRADSEEVDTFSPNPDSPVERRTEIMDNDIKLLLDSDFVVFDRSLTSALRSQEVVIDPAGTPVPELLGGIAVHTDEHHS